MIPMSFRAGRDASCPGPMYSLKGFSGAHRPRMLWPPTRHDFRSGSGSEEMAYDQAGLYICASQFCRMCWEPGQMR